MLIGMMQRLRVGESDWDIPTYITMDSTSGFCGGLVYMTWGLGAPPPVPPPCIMFRMYLAGRKTECSRETGVEDGLLWKPGRQGFSPSPILTGDHPVTDANPVSCSGHHDNAGGGGAIEGGGSPL